MVPEDEEVGELGEAPEVPFTLFRGRPLFFTFASLHCSPFPSRLHLWQGLAFSQATWATRHELHAGRLKGRGDGEDAVVPPMEAVGGSCVCIIAVN